MKGILFVLALVAFNIIVGLCFESNVHQKTIIPPHPILNEAFYSDIAEAELIAENRLAEEQKVIQERFDSCIYYLVNSLDNDFEKGHDIYLEIKRDCSKATPTFWET